MNLTELIRRLSAAQISIKLVNDEQLELATTDESVPNELLQEIKLRKADLIQFLKETTSSTDALIPRTPERTWYETSNAQQRLWMVEKIENPQGAYNISSLQQLEGRIDCSAMNQALTALSERHESLRTTFSWAEGGLKQRIHSGDQLPVTLEFEDCSADSEGIAIEAAKQFMTTVVFDLETGPLWRVKLFRLNADAYLLAFLMHHIISDKASMQVLIDEVSQLYDKALTRQPLSLPELPIQYKDYADWQEQKVNTGAFAADRNYWLSQFASEPSAIVLPIKRMRPATKSLSGESRYRMFSAETVEALRQLSGASGVSLFNVLLAATQTLLHRYTGQDELTVGTSVLGRNHRDLSRQIGYYANVLPLRTTFKPGQRFADLLALGKETLTGALSHQQYPFDKLVDDLAIRRDASRSPLFDVMVDYQYITPQPSFNTFTMREINRQETNSKFDLSFTFYHQEETLSLRLEFATELFDEDWVDRIFSHLENLIQSIALNPEATLASLNYLSKNEQAILLTEFGTGPFVERPNATIKELFEEQVRKTPDAIAVEANGETLTYRQLNEASNRVARWLTETYTVGCGDVVGLWAERSNKLIVALMGVVKTGAAFLPIDADVPRERLAYLLRDSQVPVVMTTSDKFFEITELFDGQTIAIDIQLDGLTDYASTDIPAEPQPNHLAYVLYTSGSTGYPKGVEIRKSSIVNYLLFTNSCYFGSTTGQTMPLFTSLAFDLTLTTIFSPLLRGDTVAIMPSKPIHAILQGVFSLDGGMRAVKLTPAHVSLLASLPVASTNVECAIVGGEALLDEHIQTLKRLNPAMRIYNEYGPTETTVGCTIEHVELDQPITIGRPIENTYIYILDAEQQLVPVGVWGQLCVGGDGVGAGYRNSIELTQKKFNANPFHEGTLYQTGDRARWLPDGRLDYQGRMDTQLKLRGYRIEPGEIEMVLTTHPHIKEAVVLAKSDPGQDKYLVAYITMDRSETSANIQQYLMTRLPAYMIPTRINQLDRMPLTINGKIDRDKLTTLNDGIDTNARYTGPSNELEHTLANIFEHVLMLPRISVDQNLFEVGLNSLKAIKAQLEVNTLFPDKVEIHQIFSHPTIQKLALLVGNADQEMVDAPVFETIDF